MLHNINVNLWVDGETSDAIKPARKNQVIVHFDLERPMVFVEVELHYQADGEDILVGRKQVYLREEGPYDIPFDLTKRLPVPKTGRARFVAKIRARPLAEKTETFKTAELEVKVPNIVVRVGLASPSEVSEAALTKILYATVEKVREKLPHAEYIDNAVSGPADAPTLDVYFSADLVGEHGSQYALWTIDWEGLANLIFTFIVGKVVPRLISMGHPYLAVAVIAIYVAKTILPWTMNMLALEKVAEVAEKTDKLIRDAREAGLPPEEISKLITNIYRVKLTTILPLSPPQIPPEMLVRLALLGVGAVVGAVILYKLVKWLLGGGKEKVREKIVYVMAPFQRLFQAISR